MADRMTGVVTIRVLGMEPVKQFLTNVQWVAATLPSPEGWDPIESPPKVFACREVLLDSLVDLLAEEGW